MNTSRRKFIRNSFFLGGGIAVSTSVIAGNFSLTRKFDWEIGVSIGFENSDLLKKFNYLFVEEGVKKFLAPAESEEVFLNNMKMAQKSSLPVRVCNSFLPSDLKCVGQNAVHPAILKFAETAFRRAQMAGVEIIVFGSGGSRQIPEDFSREKARKQFLELCKQMAPLAEKYKVMVVLEPLNLQECNFINSVTEGGEIVNEVGHPNFLLLADIYHMKKVDEDPEDILKYGHLLRHVHIAEKEGRSAPGTNHEDFTEYFRVLKRIRYKGMITIECRWQNMEEQLPIAIHTIQTQIGG